MSWIKSTLKQSATAVFPDLTLRITSVRSRRMIERQCEELGLAALARSICHHTGGRVACGPFMDLRLDYELLPVHSAPKYFGTYERETTGFIEDAISREPGYILNVGSSDGYFAVGLAMRLPKAVVYAAEADPKSLAAAVRNADLNGVGKQIVPVGIVRSGRLEKYLNVRNSLVVMDCEGAEFALLDPERNPCLRQSAILVEVHEDIGSPVTLIDRFRSTHTVQIASRAARTIADAPVTIPGVDPAAAMDERRGAQSWLYLTPLA